MSGEAIELLRSFRSELAEADEQTAVRVYQRAITPVRRRHEARSASGLLLRRVGSHRRFVLAVVLAAFALVSAAVAVGGKILDLFEGTPAPPAVSESFAGWNKSADM